MRIIPYSEVKAMIAIKFTNKLYPMKIAELFIREIN